MKSSDGSLESEKVVTVKNMRQSLMVPDLQAIGTEPQMMMAAAAAKLCWAFDDLILLDELSHKAENRLLFVLCFSFTLVFICKH